jgi:hypothetical protein
VSDVVSGLQVAAESLPLPEDRLLTFVEGAQVGADCFGCLKCQARLACCWPGIMMTVGQLLAAPAASSTGQPAWV